MSHQTRAKKLGPRAGRAMLAARQRSSRRWTSDEAQRLVQNAVVEEYGHGRHGAANLNDATDIPVETARNIVDGRNACSLANFFTLLESTPALRAAMRDLLDLQGMHPEEERFIDQVLRLASRLPRKERA